MMTGSIGPIQTGWLGWGLVVAALVPLLTGRAWRLGWTVGAWTVILGSLALSALLAASSLLGGAGVALFLMPTALGLSVAAAMAPLAFEDDVVSGDFGVGQLASAVGVVAMVIGLVPVLFAAPEGRWYLPEGDYQRALELVDRSDAGRTLWIGDPDVLARTITVYTDVGALRRVLSIPDDRDVWAFVVADDGAIVATATGEPDDAAWSSIAPALFAS
mgnify:CR=1 FL=1